MRPRIANAALFASIVFLGVAVFLRVRREVPRASSSESAMLSVGDNVPNYWMDLGWTEAPEGPALVAFFTTACPWCRMSAKRWNMLRDTVRTVPGARTVAVVLGDSSGWRDYPQQTDLEYPIHVVVGEEEVARRWRIAVVPYTVLLDSDGRVQGAWKGVVDSARYEVIARSVALLADPSRSSNRRP